MRGHSTYSTISPLPVGQTGDGKDTTIGKLDQESDLIVGLGLNPELQIHFEAVVPEVAQVDFDP